MRIRILQKPSGANIDGVRLEQFVPGHQYEVGNMLGSLFLCEGWAEPVDDPPPALVIPLRDFNPEAERLQQQGLPRDFFPSDYQAPPARAADRPPRRLPRRKG